MHLLRFLGVLGAIIGWIGAVGYLSWRFGCPVEALHVPILGSVIVLLILFGLWEATR